MGTYTLSTSSGLPSFFLSGYLSSRYGIILQIWRVMASTGVIHQCCGQGQSRATLHLVDLCDTTKASHISHPETIWQNSIAK